MDLDFDKLGGLIPAIIQDARTKNVLMLGFMNREAYEKTLELKKVTFFSRTRNRLWTKGEQSGNYLNIVSIEADCDRDTLLIKAIPEGSYTTSLFESGINRMAQKVGEEAVETVIEATNGTDGRMMYEASDLLYHLIVLLTAKGRRIEELAEALERRHNKKKEEYDKNC